MTVIELAEPGCRPELKRTVSARLSFGPPACERVIPNRNGHTGRDLKGCKHGFPMRVPVKLETISRFEAHVDRGHKVFPGLQNPSRICYSGIFILEELLANPAKRPVLWWPGLIGAADKRLACSRPRQEAKEWLESISVLIHVDLAGKQVIRIINLEAPTEFAARRYLALSGRRPRGDQKILV